MFLLLLCIGIDETYKITEQIKQINETYKISERAQTLGSQLGKRKKEGRERGEGDTEKEVEEEEKGERQIDNSETKE